MHVSKLTRVFSTMNVPRAQASKMWWRSLEYPCQFPSSGKNSMSTTGMHDAGMRSRDQIDRHLGNARVW